MANIEINSSLCSSELATWREHYDLMVESIKDPDALAEAACRANLISTDMKNMIVVYGYFHDAQAKTRSLLNIIAEKVKSHSTYFRLFLAVLRNLPGLNQLASRLQASYDGRLLGIPVVNDQEAGDHEEDEPNGSAAERGDNDSEAESLSEMHGDDHEQDEGIDEVDVKRNDSDSETSSCSPEQPNVVHEPEEPYISSREESIMEEENIHQQDHDGFNFEDVDDSILGEENAFSVKEMTTTLAAGFYSVGAALGLPPSELNKIRKNCRDGCDEALFQVIIAWLKQSYDMTRHGHPSWKKLVEAVASKAGGQNPALARKIAAAHRASRKRQQSNDEGIPRPKQPCIEDDKRLDQVLSDGDLGKIADSMYEWEGSIAEQLKLSPVDVAAIKKKHPWELKLQTRAALRKWRQWHGSSATYNNLVKVFERAGYNDYVLYVTPADADNSSGNLNHTPPPAAQLSSSPTFSSPQFATTSAVPLKEELQGPLVNFRSKLADLYSKKPEVSEGTWPPVKKTHYVNLALIKQTAINFAKDYVRQTVHGCIDDIIKDKEQIDYKDAFAELEDGALVVMEGRPGCGKTTLMHKLSQDWEKREILASCLFILVHFRRFSNRSDIELSDILRASTMDYTDEEIKELCTCIEKDSGRGVVFALDGLDEYCPKSKQNLLYNLIKRERLSNAVVIVASRPAASQKFRKYATKHVEVLGFLKPQIQEYIEGYFCECPDKAESLLRYLDHHLNVMHMCYLPLHSAMVTYLYDIEGANLPQTETEIYRHFTLWTLIRSLQRRSDDPDEPFILNDFSELSSDDRLVFNLILKLAFNATIESKQVFTLKEVKEQISEQLPSSGSGNDGDSLGLIVIDRYFVKYGLDEIYTFLHLTFQEFLCAYYIACQPEEKQKEILETHGANENLAEVWKFFCGVGKCSSENFSTLLSIAKCRVQVMKNSSLKLPFPNTLLHLHCAYESQKEWMCSQVVKTRKLCITLQDQSLTPSDMTALGYVIRHSEMSLKELNITHCHLGVEGLAAMLAEIGDQNLSLEKLSFSGTKIKQEMSEKFAAFLTVCSSLENLDLSSCVSKSTLTDISKKIHELSSLTTLNISSNRLGNTGDAVKAFIKKLPKLQILKVHLYKDCQWYLSMKKNGQLKDISVKTCIHSSWYTYMTEPEPLDLATCTKLDVIGLKITDKEAEVIAKRLKECTNLSELNLSGNQIGESGAQSIAEGCKLCPNLQTIYLNGNQIGDAGAHAIAEGCKLCPNIQTISLDRNQIGDVGAHAIAEGCKLCPNLQRIDLDYNQIGDSGAQSIAEGCKLCPNLQVIHLMSNSITDASVPHLVGLMETTRKLETLYLDGNQFTEAGRSQLRRAAEKRNNDPTNNVHLGLLC